MFTQVLEYNVVDTRVFKVKEYLFWLRHVIFLEPLNWINYFKFNIPSDGRNEAFELKQFRRACQCNNNWLQIFSKCNLLNVFYK